MAPYLVLGGMALAAPLVLIVIGVLLGRRTRQAPAPSHNRSLQ